MEMMMMVIVRPSVHWCCQLDNVFANCICL